jgi:PIN domain nuclease of toxin-antitoxin system
MDTHVWMWFAAGERSKLSRRATSRLERARQAGALYVSPVSALEIARLVAKGRLRLGADVLAWVEAALERSGVLLAGLTPAIAVQAGSLSAVGGDPADWILIATAQALGATLVTRDVAILGYGGAGHVRVVERRCDASKTNSDMTPFRWRHCRDSIPSHRVPGFTRHSFEPASRLVSKVLESVGGSGRVVTGHLAASFAERAEQQPDREFLVFGSRRMTYGQTLREARALANAFASLGLQAGDRLGVVLPNRPEWVIALLAAAALDVVVVPLDPALGPYELRYQLRHAEVRAVVTVEAWDGVDLLERLDQLLPELPGLRFVVTVGAEDRWLDDRVYRWADLVARAAPPLAAHQLANPAAAPLAILYTSGTMGAEL